MVTVVVFAVAILALPVVLVLGAVAIAGALLAALADGAAGLVRPRHT
jgi:hypothetical protein